MGRSRMSSRRFGGMVVKSEPRDPIASPYSTGGGGTEFEKRYGALLLCHLLTGNPVPELGDDASVVSVSFQARATSPVDDFFVVGRDGDGGTRRLSTAVRHKPRFVPSDDKSVDLVACYLAVIAKWWDEIRAGQWRLALASAATTPVRELGALTAIARAEPDDRAFREAVARDGRTTRAVRSRLEHLDKVIVAAAQRENVSGVDHSDLTWRFLSSLAVRELRLEPPDESDRTVAVASLRPSTVGGTPSEADSLFSEIERLAGRYMPAGAEVSEAMLRRDLVGSTNLRRSSRHSTAWRKLDELRARLRRRTGSHLTDLSGKSCELDRKSARAELMAAFRAVGSRDGDTSSTLVVCGEPDVGKSALALRAVEALEAADAAIVAISLRDLLPTTAECEGFLDAPIAEVLAGLEVRPVRLLIVDGAEAALEGRRDLLGDLVTAALGAGLGVVAVTRRDAERVVRETLQQSAVALSLVHNEPAGSVVGGFTPVETAEAVGNFPALAHLNRDQRGKWLLTRPGLIDLLLRADATLSLPDRPLSEADVFAAVWSGLVRRDETIALDGASPDEREQALLSLARRVLKQGSAVEESHSAALPSLRSDGLLLSTSPTAAWNAGDEFASDVVRDFAITRLLLVDGYGHLLSAEAPRWCLRAARLACQAALAAAGDATEDVRRCQQTEFGHLAARHGARWAEVPLEAMLQLPGALERAWPDLLTEGRRQLAEILRVAIDRHTRGGVAEPLMLDVLVRQIGDHWSEFQEASSRGIGGQVRALLLAWLRGRVIVDIGRDSLRARVRDVLLDGPIAHHDDFLIEAFGLLDNDCDDRAQQHLRDVAASYPGDLAPAVESGMATLSLGRNNPELLADLTEAHYIEFPPHEPAWISPADLFPGGVRGHTRVGVSPLSPSAAWSYGPFWNLLRSEPSIAIRTINRILDHAAWARLERPASHADPAELSDDSEESLQLDLSGIGTRCFVGDGGLWAWYRGSSFGPPPCTSALLAAERWADGLIAKGRTPGDVAEMLLADCHNLAMPGLVVGILVRHLDLLADELDVWLSHPDVWELEFARVVNERFAPREVAASNPTYGNDRRSYTLREVSDFLMSNAIVNDNEERITALHACGRALMAHGESSAPGSNSDHASGQASTYETTVAGWAARLDPVNYEPCVLPDGTPGTTFCIPSISPRRHTPPVPTWHWLASPTAWLGHMRGLRAARSPA